ncbi:ExbD/TolR family protein [Polycladidibacter hongkongensis]|uniref:ExbD/TolR family protein n=1 Tax=Polycladidibacter hongkongensis TaxID=1647556 RepID=UPI00082C31DA|nr:biopolymer transporter ExbD [Pseudovibrio hongkongensis]
MQISRQIKPRRAPGLTSLIDVIFLLLMFFMLASTFSKYQQLNIAGTQQGTGVSESSRPIVLRIGKQEVVFAGKSMSAEELVTHLDAKDTDKERLIALLPKEEATVQDAVDVLGALGIAGYNAKLVGK